MNSFFLINNNIKNKNDINSINNDIRNMNVNIENNKNKIENHTHNVTEINNFYKIIQSLDAMVISINTQVPFSKVKITKIIDDNNSSERTFDVYSDSKGYALFKITDEEGIGTYRLQSDFESLGESSYGDNGELISENKTASLLGISSYFDTTKDYKLPKNKNNASFYDFDPIFKIYENIGMYENTLNKNEIKINKITSGSVIEANIDWNYDCRYDSDISILNCLANHPLLTKIIDNNWELYNVGSFGLITNKNNINTYEYDTSNENYILSDKKARLELTGVAYSNNLNDEFTNLSTIIESKNYIYSTTDSDIVNSKTHLYNLKGHHYSDVYGDLLGVNSNGYSVNSNPPYKLHIKSRNLSEDIKNIIKKDVNFMILEDRNIRLHGSYYVNGIAPYMVTLEYDGTIDNKPIEYQLNNYYSYIIPPDDKNYNGNILSKEEYQTLLQNNAKLICYGI